MKDFAKFCKMTQEILFSNYLFSLKSVGLFLKMHTVAALINDNCFPNVIASAFLPKEIVAETCPR